MADAERELSVIAVKDRPSKASLWAADRRWELGSSGQFAFASTPRSYDIELGTPTAEKRIAQLHVPGTSPRDADLTRAGEAAWQDFVTLTEEANSELAKEAEQRQGQARSAFDDVLVTSLGTGSASPSVYRNGAYASHRRRFC